VAAPLAQTTVDNTRIVYKQKLAGEGASASGTIHPTDIRIGGAHIAANDTQLVLTIGAYFDGAQFIATQTTCIKLQMDSTGFNVATKFGAVIDSPVLFIPQFNIDATGIINVTSIGINRYVKTDGSKNLIGSVV
jgi:hypothetical protein